MLKLLLRSLQKYKQIACFYAYGPMEGFLYPVQVVVFGQNKSNTNFSQNHLIFGQVALILFSQPFIFFFILYLIIIILLAQFLLFVFITRIHV